jgi:hypothetical protein
VGEVGYVRQKSQLGHESPQHAQVKQNQKHLSLRLQATVTSQASFSGTGQLVMRA